MVKMSRKLRQPLHHPPPPYRLHTMIDGQMVRLHQSGAPNDGFLPNSLKRCFRLSGVLLKLCRLILGCAIKIVSVRFF